MKINWKLILIIFVMFLLFTDGAVLGQNTRSFVEWVSSGWDSVVEFFDSLISETEEVPE